MKLLEKEYCGAVNSLVRGTYELDGQVFWFLIERWLIEAKMAEHQASENESILRCLEDQEERVHEAA